MKLNRTNGTLIIGVVDNSPADKAGLKEYDFITKFDGQNVENAGELSRMISDSQVGKSYAVEYIRKGKTKKTNVILEENPNDKTQAAKKTKTYRGQKSPYELGFSITKYSSDLAKEFGLPPLRKAYPVIIDVDNDSPAQKAGLGIGDIIVDVNRQEVNSEADVIKLLKNKEMNSLRVLRGQTPLLVYINPK